MHLEAAFEKKNRIDHLTCAHRVIKARWKGSTTSAFIWGLSPLLCVRFLLGAADIISTQRLSSS